ncbi:hypothetical protein HD554DRAFT_2035091 [Boletus coccyginus]|nr:hypothetical protein HD554DRAFT_2035091 [Boletus coccyginus]
MSMEDLVVNCNQIVGWHIGDGILRKGDRRLELHFQAFEHALFYSTFSSCYWDQRVWQKWLKQFQWFQIWVDSKRGVGLLQYPRAQEIVSRAGLIFMILVIGDYHCFLFLGEALPNCPGEEIAIWKNTFSGTPHTVGFHMWNPGKRIEFFVKFSTNLKHLFQDELNMVFEGILRFLFRIIIRIDEPAISTTVLKKIIRKRQTIEEVANLRKRWPWHPEQARKSNSLKGYSKITDQDMDCSKTKELEIPTRKSNDLELLTVSDSG